MVIDVFAVILLIGFVVLMRRSGDVVAAVVDLPPADLPPLASVEAVPSGRRLDDYVGHGLDEIDDWLRGNQAA